MVGRAEHALESHARGRRRRPRGRAASGQPRRADLLGDRFWGLVRDRVSHRGQSPPACPPRSVPGRGPVSSTGPAALDKRLTRILLLIPYLLKNPGSTTGELAERFGVPVETVVEDLQLVYVCGLPGYGPGDLIDV